MLNESRRVTWEEACRFAQLVAAHWLRTARNPSDAECDEMVAIAREMAAVNAVLQ